MTSTPLADHEVTLACPCGEKLRKTLGWLKDHPRFACACGQQFDATEVAPGLGRAQEALDGIHRKIASINLKI